jgi:hypothetical protein
LLDRKRLFALFDMVRVTDLFLASCLRRLSFALKWLLPAFRVIILPFFVTLSRLAYDLLVFILLERGNAAFP